jgi:hypothetical protein
MLFFWLQIHVFHEEQLLSNSAFSKRNAIFQKYKTGNIELPNQLDVTLIF